MKPFLEKLRPTGGLIHLTLMGIQHKQNICDFKYGFVQQGGTFFRTMSPSGKKVKTIKVTHDDLRMVSPYVRAIVEKDRALMATSQGLEDVPDAVCGYRSWMRFVRRRQ